MKRYNALILVVEDDPNDQQMIQAAFRANGVTEPIQIVGQSSEAIAYLMADGKHADRRQFPYPTFVLIDLRMSEGHGFAVLEHLKRNPESAIIPTVVLSQSDEPNDITRSYMLGASSYLLKPRDFEELKKQFKQMHDYWLTCEVPEVSITGKQLSTEGRGKLGERFLTSNLEQTIAVPNLRWTRASYHSLILVVEDDPGDQMLIERAFRGIGVTGAIHIVANGGEAIAYMKGEGKYSDRELFPYPTFVMTDLKMPVADGFDVLAHLKRNPEWAIIPTVVLSASADPDDIRKSYMLGANGYHVKPNDFGGLKRQLKALHDYWMMCEVPARDITGRRSPIGGERSEQAA